MSTQLDQPLTFHADSPPLRTNKTGTVRVGTTRILLDLVVEQYDNGMSLKSWCKRTTRCRLADDSWRYRSRPDPSNARDDLVRSVDALPDAPPDPDVLAWATRTIAS